MKTFEVLEHGETHEELNEFLDSDLKDKLRIVFKSFNRNDLAEKLDNLSKNEILTILFLGFSTGDFFDQIRDIRDREVLIYPREDVNEIVSRLDDVFDKFDSFKKVRGKN